MLNTIPAIKADFLDFSTNVHATYEAMAKGELYVVDLTSDIFDAYLAAFPEGTNPLYKERTEYDCNCCKSFIRTLGKVVSINEGGSLTSVWSDWASLPSPFQEVAEALDALVTTSPVVGVFRTAERRYGSAVTVNLTTHERWNHFVGAITDAHFTPTPDAARGELATAAHVFRRGLEEIRPEDLATVLDLIDSNSLYRGEEHRDALASFQRLQSVYRDAERKDTFIWRHLKRKGSQVRNSVIGSLLVDLAKGVDLDDAVRAFESRVAPANYKRPTAVITPKMIESALAQLATLGLEEAVYRRFARLDDVSVTNVLFVDGSVRPQMRGGLSGLLMQHAKTSAVSVKNATAISGDEFFTNVVPSAKSVQVIVENRHLGNFVSLTAPVHPDAGQLFKWPNGFAWSYDGDVADSIKERVKAAGGKVDAKFRVSLAWSNYDDLDLHVHTPLGDHIHFSCKQARRCSGQLDVDMNAHSGKSRTPVENIFWNGLMHSGVYVVEVNNFSKRESIDVGFSLEVEFDGRISQFSYAKAVANGDTIEALRLTVEHGSLVSIEPMNSGLVGGDIPTEKWGLTTGQLAQVDTLMLSPNHWDGNAVGNKHHFFLLKGCANPGQARGIYNEFLRNDLDAHRKVFEAVGARTKTEPSDQQLSGLGFSSTRGDEVTAVVDGRAYAIKF